MKYLLVVLMMFGVSTVFGQNEWWEPVEVKIKKVEAPRVIASAGIGYFFIWMDNFDKVYDTNHGMTINVDACVKLVSLNPHEGLYGTVAWSKFGKTGDMVFEDMSAANVDDGGCARDVTISSNETIFLANGWDGLRAYTYSNSGGF